MDTDKLIAIGVALCVLLLFASVVTYAYRKSKGRARHLRGVIAPWAATRGLGFAAGSIFPPRCPRLEGQPMGVELFVEWRAPGTAHGEQTCVRGTHPGLPPKFLLLVGRFKDPQPWGAVAGLAGDMRFSVQTSDAALAAEVLPAPARDGLAALFELRPRAFLRCSPGTGNLHAKAADGTVSFPIEIILSGWEEDPQTLRLALDVMAIACRSRATPLS